MGREWILLVASVTAAVLLTLGLLRWFSPELLGIRSDLQIVRVGKPIPAFFDGVFREKDYESGDFFLPDPFIRRARPLYPDEHGQGPTDILGFRNRMIPNVADVIVIGDSQTYGNNVVVEQNWPNQTRVLLGAKQPAFYSMAVGGWGAVEYLEIAPKALLFKPRIVVVAFYTGNDPFDSFRRAYADDRWIDLRPDPAIDVNDIPIIVDPPPASDQWSVIFADGVKTVFTPALRLGANQDHPAIVAGYSIMAAVARRIAETARAAGVKIVFTILPTKETVYADKVAREQITPVPAYRQLVAAELNNIKHLAGTLREIPGARYVDVLGPLQSAALESVALFPSSMDGHPVQAGYGVIARALAPAIDTLLPAPPDGLVAVPDSAGERQVYLARDRQLWSVSSYRILQQNGWSREDITKVSIRDVAGYPYAGRIDRVDPRLFGPERIKGALFN